MKVFVILFWSNVLFIQWISAQNNDISSTLLHCSDINPQNTINIEQIMGMWYGIEVITHNTDDEHDDEITNDKCVVIHLSEYSMPTTTTEYPNSYKQHRSVIKSRYIKLLWDEHGEILTYILSFNNSRRGFWLSSPSSSDRNSMFDLPKNQFIGTVQVMKASENNLVLSFCQSFAKNQLFTINLARSPMSLSNDDINSGRTILRRRGFSTINTKKICVLNGATKITSSVLIFAILTYKIIFNVSDFI